MKLCLLRSQSVWLHAYLDANSTGLESILILQIPKHDFKCEDQTEPESQV